MSEVWPMYIVMTILNQDLDRVEIYDLKSLRTRIKRTKNSCRISKSTTLPQVTSHIITFSRMVRFSCVLPLWKAFELMIMPVLTVLKNIEN